MIINHNLPAVNANNKLNKNVVGVKKSTEKLSSGFRINRAADDAAGLAISEKMRAHIRGLSQAVRNANDGVSLIQTAEGALDEVHDMLKRLKELAVMFGTDTDNQNTNDRSDNFDGQWLISVDNSAKGIPRSNAKPS